MWNCNGFVNGFARTFYSVAHRVLDFLRKVVFLSDRSPSKTCANNKAELLAMGLFPDEGKSIPPPAIVNVNSLYLAGMGWGTAILDNGLKQRPPMKSGVHRQVLFTTIGWFLGYHLSKYVNYAYAKADREMEEYMKLHAERFPERKKRTFAEITEPFCPIR